MAAPALLAGAGIFGSIASGVMGAQGAEQSAAAQAAQYQYQAGVALANKQIAQQNADYAIQVGEQQAQRYGMQAAQTRGKIVAAQGASGVDVGSGSAQAVQEGQRLVTSIDLNTIRTQAGRTAYNYTVEGAMAEAQAGAYQSAAADTLAAGDIKATTSLISGATSVASKWLQAQQSGIFS